MQYLGGVGDPGVGLLVVQSGVHVVTQEPPAVGAAHSPAPTKPSHWSDRTVTITRAMGRGVEVNLQPVFQPAGMARLFQTEGLYSTAVPSLPVKNSSDITEAVPEGASRGRVRQREKERGPNESSSAGGGGRAATHQRERASTC